MEWIVLNAVTAAMQMAVIPPLATVAVSQDGQVYTVTACVQKGTGDPTVRCPVIVTMVHPAPLTKASASAHPDTEATPARESVPLAFMVTAAASLAHSACTAMDPAIT